MYYVPKHFHPKEIFSSQVIHYHSINNNVLNSIWRLMDSRVLWTADQLRDIFGPMIVNDYMFGGNNEQRGFRDPLELLDKNHYNNTNQYKPLFSSFTSQHCFGRALDTKIVNYLSETVRQYIIRNKKKEQFKHITAIEKNVSWLHFDTRSYKKEQKGFLIF